MSMIQDITAQVPRYKKPLRKGRGESSGHGKTSGRGGKGASARGGGPYWKTGHEGGQTPLYRRLPTRGFSNDRWARDWYIVNLGELEAKFADGSTVDAAALKTAGLIPDLKLPVKILGDGQFTRKLTVQVGWYSKSALAKIQALGGTAQNAKGEAFAFPKPRPRFDQVAKGGKAEKGGGKKKEKPAAEGEAKKPAEAPAAVAPAESKPEQPQA